MSFLCCAGVTHAADAPAVCEVHFVKTWGEEGAGPGQFHAPVGIAITAADEIYVTDHYNSRMQKFDTDGKFVAAFPTLPAPGMFAMDAEGDFYITHFAVSGAEHDAKVRLSVYAPDGTFLREWGKSGKDDGDFDYPGGVAVGKDRQVYVADQTNHRVQVFDATGKFLRKWGEYGNDPGQFGGMESKIARTGGPQCVALDATGNVWTTEGMNCRIQKFSPDGKPLLAWGSLDDKPGAFGGTYTMPAGGHGRLKGPIALLFDKQDRLWVGAVSGRIQRFSQDGQFQCGQLDGQGAKPGQFIAPHGLALDSKGNLYVVDLLNNRVQKFSVTN